MADQGNATGFLSDEVHLTYKERQILAAVAITVAVFGTTGNVLVIAAVALSKRLHHATNMFVLNLSIADLLTCTHILPTEIVAFLSVQQLPLPLTLCTITAFLYLLCLGCSINSLACIAINRYVMVTQNKATYNKLFAGKRTLAAIVLIWLVPMCILIALEFNGCIKLGYEPKNSTCTWVLAASSPGGSIALFTTFFPAQFSVIFWSYIRVFCHVRSHAKKVQHLGNPTGVATVMQIHNRQAWQKRTQDNKLQLEVTKNLFCVVCVFALCITPYNLSLVLINKEKFSVIGGLLVLGNSCVNPVIYAAKHPHFRAVFRCIISGKFAEIPNRVSFRFFK